MLLPKPTSHGKDLCAVDCEKGHRYVNIYEKEANLPLSHFGRPPKAAFRIPPLTDRQLKAKLPKKK